MDLAWAYTIVRNEKVMLPWWLRHYRTFCARMIVYDDESDDGTPELAREFGADVRKLPFSGFDDALMVELAGRTYKEARGLARWVIWVDADEFIVSRHYMSGPLWGTSIELQRLAGIGARVPDVRGYQMYADAVPEGPGQLYDYVTVARFDTNYAKKCVVDPKADIYWGPGRHGTYGMPFDPSHLDLLHFRWLGRAYYLQRSARNYARLPKHVIGMFGHATYPENRLKEADAMEAEFRALRQ